jgi:hypothetical protein
MRRARAGTADAGARRGQAELVAAHVSGRPLRALALLMLLPLYLWVGFMSTIPHKEERFAYVVYPQAR